VSDCESEGSPWANLWSDEQKSHIRHTSEGKIAKQIKAR